MQESQTVLQHRSLKSVDVVCRRCRSKSVVVSRPRGIEHFIASVLPCHVCRCVDCYNRFWAIESLFANKKRVLVWFFLVFTVVVVMVLKLSVSEQNVDLKKNGDSVPQFDQHRTDQEEVPSFDTTLTSNDVLSDTGGINHEDDVFEMASTQSEDSKKLSNAKLQSEEWSVVQKESLERLEQAIIKDQGALESLLKIDMNYRVDRWREAWQSGLSDDYLEFYSKNFQPNNGLPFNEWVDQRKKRINPDKKINIELMSFDVSFSSNMKKIMMEFDQLYSSEAFSEKIRKQLVWVKDADEWKIISETELNN